MNKRIDNLQAQTRIGAIIICRARPKLAIHLLKHFVLTMVLSIVVLSLYPSVMAQTVLVGTGDPTIDVPMVQGAVNSGGDVLMQGTFSFTGAGSGSPRRVVTITNSVRVIGVVDTNGEEPLIINGDRPFFVAAPGASVSFDGLRFQTPKTVGISLASAGSVRIANCRFNGLTGGLIGTESVGIAILSVGGPFGTISVVNNDIDAQAVDSFSANGIILSGTTGTIEISANVVRNTNAHAIDLRNVVGDAHVWGNDVVTGSSGRGGGPGQFVDALRCVGSGNYLIENNSIDFGFLNEAGIRLGGTSRAVVRANNVTGSVDPGLTPGQQSAAIQVEGGASETSILNNRLYGYARAAFSVVHSDFALDKRNGIADPDRTSFIGNNHELFNASLVDIEIGAVANQTLIVGGAGTIVDLGVGTLITGGYRTLSGDKYKSTTGLGEAVSGAEEIWTEDWPTS